LIIFAYKISGMKKIIGFLLATVIILSGVAVHAQENEEGFSNSESGYTKGMGGPIISFSTIHGEFSVFMGGGGGVVLKKFILGVYGMGQASQIEDWHNSNRFVSIWHGGIWLGYSFLPDKIVHPVIELNAGMGNFSTFAQNDYSSLYTDKTGVFVLSPKLGVEFTVSSFVKIGVGGEYRYANFTKPNTSYSSKDISAPAGYITIKLGEF